MCHLRGSGAPCWGCICSFWQLLKEPCFFFFASQQAVLGEYKKKPAAGKKKKGFSDKREEIQNQLKNQNLKSMIIVNGRKTHNLKSASLGTWLRTIALEGSHLDFPAGLNGKESPILQETWVQSLGQEDCLEEGMATHSGILAWRIPWTGESGGLQSIVVQRVGHTKWLTLLPFHITLETVPQCWGSSLKTYGRNQIQISFFIVEKIKNKTGSQISKYNC